MSVDRRALVLISVFKFILVQSVLFVVLPSHSSGAFGALVFE